MKKIFYILSLVASTVAVSNSFAADQIKQTTFPIYMVNDSGQEIKVGVSNYNKTGVKLETNHLSSSSNMVKIGEGIVQDDSYDISLYAQVNDIKHFLMTPLFHFTYLHKQTHDTGCHTEENHGECHQDSDQLTERSFKLFPGSFAHYNGIGLHYDGYFKISQNSDIPYVVITITNK